MTDAEFLRQTFAELRDVVRSIRTYSASRHQVSGQYVVHRMKDVDSLLDKLSRPRCPVPEPAEETT